MCCHKIPLLIRVRAKKKEYYCIDEKKLDMIVLISPIVETKYHLQLNNEQIRNLSNLK